jgi:hypothetical protein
MKQTIFYLGIALFSMCMLCPAKGKADAVLGVSGPANVSVGDSFTIDIGVSQAADLYGFQFDLGFDPTILQATRFAEGTFLTSQGSTFFFNNGIDNVAGTVAFNADTLIGVSSGASGDGLLMTFDFASIAAGTSGLTISNVVLSDSNGNSLPFAVQNNSVDVNEVAVSTPEPSTFSMMLGALVFLGLAAVRKR